jgi:hypothetical protein
MGYHCIAYLFELLCDMFELRLYVFVRPVDAQTELGCMKNESSDWITVRIHHHASCQDVTLSVRMRIICAGMGLKSLVAFDQCSDSSL